MRISRGTRQNMPARGSTTGLRRLVDDEQQRAWVDGNLELYDVGERAQSLEQRLKYAARFAKLLRRPQAPDVLDLLRTYARNCLPVPRLSERHYWSVSCLPSTSDKPLVRVNASWMELFTIYADNEDIRSRVLVHLSSFANQGTHADERVAVDFLKSSATKPDDIGVFFPTGPDIIGINVRGAASMRVLLGSARVLQAIRTFNLTHMNRGRNAYQASHSYGVADHMLGDGTASDQR